MHSYHHQDMITNDTEYIPQTQQIVAEICILPYVSLIHVVFGNNNIILR